MAYMYVCVSQTSPPGAAIRWVDLASKPKKNEVCVAEKAGEKDR